MAAQLQQSRPACRCVVAFHKPASCLPRAHAFKSCAGTPATCLVPSSPLHSCCNAKRRPGNPHAVHPRRRKSVLVRANWGAPVDFKPVKVVSNKQVAHQMHQVILDVGSLADGYKVPGQYIQVKPTPDSKPGFFAVASPPVNTSSQQQQAGILELLVKIQPGSAAEALCKAPAGSAVLASPVMGLGFPLDRLPPSSAPTLLLLLATGSGISPIKAAIESGALLQGDQGDQGQGQGQGGRRRVRLYYGTRDRASTPYEDLIPQWRALGVEVTQVYSNDDSGSSSDSSGSSSKVYVQDVLERDLAAEGPLADPKSVAALLCGQKTMCEGVKAVLARHGVSMDNVLLNF